jgi:hypothetical protein
MNLFLCIIFLGIIPAIYASLIQNKNAKICAHCKFFIPYKNQCTIFGNVDIITGVNNYESESVARNNEEQCGEDAIFFKKNYFKVITEPYYYTMDNTLQVFYTSFTISLYMWVDQIF